jgi:hypothetical protein
MDNNANKYLTCFRHQYNLIQVSIDFGFSNGKDINKRYYLILHLLTFQTPILLCNLIICFVNCKYNIVITIFVFS